MVSIKFQSCTFPPNLIKVVWEQWPHPVTSQSSAGGLSLDSAEERQMEVFGKDQQQQPLHPLGGHLQGRQDKQAHSYSNVLHIDLKP